ncbi:hypothetical protein Bca4012_054051 [Brassica carinata]
MKKILRQTHKEKIVGKGREVLTFNLKIKKSSTMIKTVQEDFCNHESRLSSEMDAVIRQIHRTRVTILH